MKPYTGNCLFYSLWIYFTEKDATIKYKYWFHELKRCKRLGINVVDYLKDLLDELGYFNGAFVLLCALIVPHFWVETEDYKYEYSVKRNIFGLFWSKGYVSVTTKNYKQQYEN